MIRLKLQRFLFAENLSLSGSEKGEGEATARNCSIVSKKPSLYIFYDYSIFITTIIPSAESSFRLQVRIIAPASSTSGDNSDVSN